MPVIAIGEGAREVIGQWADPFSVQQQSMRVIDDARQRSRRVLKAESLDPVDEGRYFVDDVMVSGKTVRTALDAAQSTNEDRVVVGMAFNSSSMRRLVDTPFDAVITYEQEGGGTPSVNSVSTLAKKPELAQDYMNRKQISQSLMNQIMNIYGEIQ